MSGAAPGNPLETRLTGLSPQKRALIEKLLEQRKAGSFRSDAIGRRPPGATAPLSYAQQRLWMLDRMTPGSSFYIETNRVPLSFRVDAGLVQKALNEVVRRHEILRTNFPVIDGMPVQAIRTSLFVPLEVVDLRSTPAVGRAGKITAIARQEAARIADLSRDPLLRATLVQSDLDQFILLLSMHHIVLDGWSLSVLVGELTSLYQAFAAGQPSPLPELPIQYADYSVWQREWLDGDLMRQQLAYWKRQLDGIPFLQLPADHPRPPVQTYRGATCEFSIGEADYTALKDLSQREGVTLFMTLLAAFQILLYRYTGQEDIVVGVPVSGRHRSEITPLIGFFVNTLVMRARLSGEMTFLGLLAEVRSVALAAYANQDLPFEKLVEELQPERDMSRNPLFQVVFQLFAALYQDRAGGGQDVHRVDTGSAKFDLRFDLLEMSARLDGYLEYSTDLFDAATIEAMARHYVRILRGIIVDPNQLLAAIPMLAEEEESQLAVEWNRTAAPLPELCVHELFAAQAARTPEALAVSGCGCELTYAELERRADRLAAALQERGVGRDVPVVVLMERSPDWVVALLAVLKSGGAYVPLDPASPPERIAAMIEGLGSPLVLTSAAMPAGAAAPRPSATPGDLAYLIFTSGSTGTPRAVEISHRSLVNLVAWHQRTYDVTPDDRATQVASAAFDASVWELWPYLCAGASVFIADNSTIALPSRLLEWMVANRITVSFLPTPLAEAVLAEPAIGRLRLRALLTGGDRLHSSRFADLPFPLYNHYGPTENAVVSTSTRVLPSADGSPPPIGKPIANTSAFILDRHFNLVPPGVTGELFLAGAGLARGYRNLDEVSRDRFLETGQTRKYAPRLYRTGDLVRYRRDGNIEFLGRLDDQVKIRGFRIELGEIEAVLASHPAVAEVAVVSRREAADSVSLVAYVTPRTGGASADLLDERLADWRIMFDEVARRSPVSRDPDFDIAGWNSSYTGQLIPEAEMREQVEQTVARVLEYAPRRVLEVGCGSGLLLLRLAPQCERYTGTDFSAATLAGLARRVETRGLRNVTLLERTADRFDGLCPAGCDTVILNSVVQYFPSAEYLTEVLERAVDALGGRGRVFVGDVRSLPLLEAFQASVELARNPDETTVEALRSRIRQGIAEVRELVIDPAFFAAFARRRGGIHAVIQPRRGRLHNELTKFRYDVVLECGGAAFPNPVESFDWSSLNGLDGLHAILDRNPSALRIRNIPDARLESEVKLLEWLAAPGATTAGELRAALGALERRGVEPEDLWSPGRALDGRVFLTPRPHGRLDAWFLPRSAGGPPPPAEEQTPGERALINTPVQQRARARLAASLRTHIQEKLPAYMVPSAFVLLDRMPLTQNGKIDRRALPPPDQRRPELVESYVEPATPVEHRIAAIWGELLGLDKVGCGDNFFDLGGHSLLLVRLHARLKETLGVDIRIVDLFRYPTIASLSRFLDCHE